MAIDDGHMDNLPHMLLTIGLADCVNTSRQAAVLARNGDAREFLSLGITRRLLAIHYGLEGIEELAPTGRKLPLTLGEQSKLGLFLNSMFLNLIGTMDNLALAVFYEHQIPKATKDGRQVPLSQIGLFKKSFMQEIGALSTTFQKVLMDKKTWNQFLEGLRHPIAHRIPIYAVPATVNQKESAEHQRMQNLIVTNINNGEPEKNEGLWEEITKIGEYEPAFCLDDHGKSRVFPIMPRIKIDVENLIQVLREGLILFRTKSET